MRPHKTPTHSRSFAVTITLAIVATARLAGAEGFSEADVISLARTNDLEAISARADVAVAEADGVEAGLYANPSLGWDREHLAVAGPGEETEDALVLTVPLDFSSRRRTRVDLAQADVATTDARATRTQSDAIVSVLDLFHRLLVAERRTDIEEQTAKRLAEAMRIVTRRTQEGSAAGYEQARVEIEAGLAASDTRRSRARAERLRTELALRLGLDAGSATFTGELAGDPAIALEPSTPETAHSRRSVELLRTAESRAEDAQSAAAWAWVPELSISGGPRFADDGDARDGYVAGLSIEVPIFSRGQDLRARARAEQHRARSRLAAAERSAEIERVSAEHAVRTARQEALLFDEDIHDRAQRLERAAESGYREGERTLTELLDAHRARTTVDIRRLELALSVKRAEVALRATTGEFE